MSGLYPAYEVLKRMLEDTTEIENLRLYPAYEVLKQQMFHFWIFALIWFVSRLWGIETIKKGYIVNFDI